MRGKKYLELLVLCTILSQGIASLSDNITTNSLDLLLRKKRIIDPTGSQRHPQIHDVPYVVAIQANGEHICTGIILNARVILTAASCVSRRTTYRVMSDSVLLGHGRFHTVVGLLLHYLYSMRGFAHNIALLSIHEPIVLGAGHHNPINIYQGEFHPPPRTVVSTSGWGAVMNSHGAISYPNELRTANLNTISLDQCRERFHRFPFSVPDDVICTYHERRRIGRSDGGNPLVFNGHLVGVQVSDWNEGGNGIPDVFLNVALSENRDWIFTHIVAIPPYPEKRGLLSQFSWKQKGGQVHPSIVPV